jgi:hypothetical protein
LEEIDQRVADQGKVEEKVRVWGDFRTREEKEEGGSEDWQRQRLNVCLLLRYTKKMRLKEVIVESRKIV